MINTEQYQTIQLQLEKEKNELMQEISILMQRKGQAEQKRDYEVKVFCSRNKPIMESSSALAGPLIGDNFTTERMKQLKNEVKKLTEFVQMNEIKLERLKEKESTIDSLYEESKKQRQKEQDKKEENQLFDLKMSKKGEIF